MSLLDSDRVWRAVSQDSLLAPCSDFAYALSIVLNCEVADEKIELHAVLLGLQGQAQAAQMMLKRALVIYPAGASNFLQVLASLQVENRNNLEPLQETAHVFLQEHKQYAFHTE